MALSRLYSEHLSKKTAPAEALRQAMIEARTRTFEIEKEPQIKKTKDPGNVSLEHPFFWAGFLVVDQPRIKAPQGAQGNIFPAPKNPPPVKPAPTVTPVTPPAVGAPSGKPVDNKAIDPADPQKMTPEKQATDAGTGEKPIVIRPKPGGVF